MDNERSPTLVPAVDRAIQILNIFESGEETLGVSDISRRLDLNKSTVYEILNTLAHHDFLERDDATKKYRLGASLFHLGNMVGARLNLSDVARPFVRDLCAQVDETVILGTPTLDDHILIVDVAEPELDMKITASVGRRLHHSAGAPGKIFHAALPRHELAELLARKPLRPFTSRTLTAPEAYIETLEEVRRAGYAVDDEEYLEGVRAVAAPVLDRSGLVVAALYAVGFSSRLTPERMRMLTRLVPATARRISRQLGARTYPTWNGHNSTESR